MANARTHSFPLSPAFTPSRALFFAFFFQLGENLRVLASSSVLVFFCFSFLVAHLFSSKALHSRNTTLTRVIRAWKATVRSVRKSDWIRLQVIPGLSPAFVTLS